MKAFQFRLQTKLNIAERLEHVAREEMQRATMARNQLQEDLYSANRRLGCMQDSVRELSRGPGLFEKILIIKQYIPVMIKSIKEIEHNLAEAEQQVEKCRLDLLEKKKELQTLERLKDKAWHRYLHELQLEEQKLIDEVAIGGHFHRH